MTRAIADFTYNLLYRHDVGDDECFSCAKPPRECEEDFCNGLVHFQLQEWCGYIECCTPIFDSKCDKCGQPY